MNRVNNARLFSLAALAALATLAACSGSDASTPGIKTGGNFVVLKTEPVDNGQLFLNDPIRIDFSNKVDLGSVDLQTFTFQVFNQLGNPVTEQVAGNFGLGRSPGDTDIGRRLEFVPRFPTNNTFDNGGFRPGRTYFVQLIGGDRVNGTSLRDVNGKALLAAVSFRFSTAEGTTPAQLFRNSSAGGPRRVALDITPTPDATGVVLNRLGSPPVEVRLGFDQPLNPSTTNLPVQLDTNPLVRNINSRGRVFLEYDDPVFGNNAWLPADVELESNDLVGATLALRPVGVLPNNAEIRIIVESSLEDISGESNVTNAAYNRIFGTFRTKRAYEQQFDAVVEDFLDGSAIDLAAPFSEPVADVGPGYLKAGFAFEGTPTNLEFEPSNQEVILNTNFTQVTPLNGVPYNVSGGVFNFKRVKIPQGVTVRGQGTNPMVWLVAGTFEVVGNLTVRGGNGEKGIGVASANFPCAGGVGACGGGTGGAGSPSTTMRDASGATGNGPLEVALRGGTGGLLACVAGCGRGSGGGGGALATQGDPNYRSKTLPVSATNPQPIFPQQTGSGGKGCTGIGGSASRQLDGGVSGALVFVDARDDNNFWGSGINFRTNLRITGELAAPIGGGGGGGGGDLSYNNDCSTNDPNFANDSRGGGGGGGGGVLVVKALGDIIIRESGHISADGGSGGGGEVNGSSSKGGAGGGGAGGMVVLMSATRIEMHVHGGNSTVSPFARIDKYSEKEYDFAISADGGVTTTGTTLAPIVLGKYPLLSSGLTARGVEVMTPATYDAAPLGGFGGMGIVQLMAPPGTNADNTNTKLDDNIKVMRLGVELTGPTGAQKQAMLAWRGFPNAAGVLVDDNGIATNIGDNEGDIRPAPILMPTPVSHKSRLRSKWIDTGATVRRALLADDGLPRGIVEQGGSQAGPKYQFAGVEPATGYVRYTGAGGEAIRIVYPTAVTATPILGSDANATFLGKPAYRVELTTATLGDVVDLYTQYEAELLDTLNQVVGSYRILSHTNRVLWLSPEGGALPPASGTGSATSLQVRTKFFKIVTGNAEGLGSTYPGSVGSVRVPNANVQIGFAFHQNPASSTATRYPAAPGTYAYNLEDPAVQEAIRLIGAAYVQFDVLFDAAFKSIPGDQPPALSPSTPRPELHFLRLPFRF